MRVLNAAVVLAALALVGCGTSPKTHYYTLAVVPGAAQGTVAISPPVTVAAVHVPPSLDRRSMVRRTGTNTVDVSGQDRWVAPLGEMTRRVLSQDLAARLARNAVVPPDSPGPPRVAQIVVSIAEFGPDGQGKVTLEGSWSLLRGGRHEPVLRRDVALAIAASARGGSGEAAAMSQLLGQLATRIAGTLADTTARAQSRRE